VASAPEQTRNERSTHDDKRFVLRLREQETMRAIE
jgi:hypothetical protein